MPAKTTTVDPAALALPAPFVNIYQVTVLADGVVRFSFAERLRGVDDDAYRAAVTMSSTCARELALSVLTMLGTTPATPS
jgi:hypothetical protein